MRTRIDHKMLEQGYCWGEYEVTVDTGPRIRLNSAIVKVLEEHAVQELWRYPDPTGPRMILCPGQHRSTYMKAAQQNFPSSLEPEDAYRRFICVGKPVRIHSRGKVSITTACKKHCGIKEGEQAVILGVGLWYEVWRWDDWASQTRTGATEQRAHS